MSVIHKYELTPVDGRKSFYGKCYVEVDDMGTETLYSYNTKIISKYCNGTLRTHYTGEWTATTGRHIKAFCGLSKKEYLMMTRCQDCCYLVQDDDGDWYCDSYCKKCLKVNKCKEIGE